MATLQRDMGFTFSIQKRLVLLGRKYKYNKGNPRLDKNAHCMDAIFSLRRGQSQKPNELYEIAEKLIPNGYYLELFGRRNNLRKGWITLGDEL